MEVKIMDDVDAILIIEVDETATREDEIAAYQCLIDSRVIWKMQGSYIRTAKDLINRGLCTKATNQEVIISNNLKLINSQKQIAEDICLYHSNIAQCNLLENGQVLATHTINRLKFIVNKHGIVALNKKDC